MTEPAWTDGFEPYAREIQERFACPGIAVAVARDGKLIYARGFGHRDRESGLPMTAETSMAVASVTKQFTCVGIMQLQEAGLLSVLDPVTRYLPELASRFGPFADVINIHHLMTHSAGFPPLDPTLISGASGYQEFLDRFAAADFAWLGRPGSIFSYSNHGFAMLGAIIERVSGQPCHLYITERILKPAGMVNSSFTPWEDPGVKEMASVYTRRPRARDASDHEVVRTDRYPLQPARASTGALWSTVTDLVRFLEVYRTGGVVGTERILAPESVRAMTSPQMVTYSPGRAYGYGLHVGPRIAGGLLVEHGGNLPFTASYVSLLPESGLTAAIITNVNMAPVDDLLLGALNTAVGVPVQEPAFTVQPYPCPAERLPEFAGRYRTQEGADITVTVAGEGLVVEAVQGQAVQRQEAGCLGPDLFLAGRGETGQRVTFLRGDDGRIWALAMGVRVIPRVPCT